MDTLIPLALASVFTLGGAGILHVKTERHAGALGDVLWALFVLCVFFALAALGDQVMHRGPHMLVAHAAQAPAGPGW